MTNQSDEEIAPWLLEANTATLRARIEQLFVKRHDDNWRHATDYRIELQSLATLISEPGRKLPLAVRRELRRHLQELIESAPKEVEWWRNLWLPPMTELPDTEEERIAKLRASTQLARNGR